MAEKSSLHQGASRFAWWALLLCVLAITTSVRLRLLEMPLERDEGEYAYAGQLLLSGIAPYHFAYSVKFPGTYAAYAVIMACFGQTIRGIHLGLLFVNAADAVVIFLIARKLGGRPAAIAAASSYAVLSVNPWAAGLAAHAAQFAMLPVLGGTLILLSPPRQLWSLAASALLFGVGILMKQPAAVFVLFGAGFLFLSDRAGGQNWRRIISRNALFLGCSVIPFAVTALLLWWAGVFAKFWFWTIDYARAYGGLVSISQAAHLFVSQTALVVGSAWGLWLLAGAGLVGCALKFKREGVILAGFFLASLIALSAGFYFREHYYFFLLPAISLFVGMAVATVSDLNVRRARAVRFIALIVLGAALAWPLIRTRDLLFRLPPDAVSRTLYWPNPFPESLRVAEYLRDHTSRADKIAVLGSEPQIYFYSDRLSATGYIYTYGLMEPQKYAARMQDEMIREIEEARPKYLVLVAINESWLRRSTSEMGIFSWANEYCAQNYKAVGLVNLLSPDRTDYFFDTVPGSVPDLRNYILIYERIP